jgi:hypothetical protein
MSNENPSSPRSCASLAQDMHELALGILTGRERAVALDHLDRCPRCRAEVDRLSLAADSILQMTAPSEPPVGFELQLFEHLGLRPTPRKPLIGRRVSSGREAARRAVHGEGRWGVFRRRPLIVFAAAVAAVTLAFGGGILAGTTSTPAHQTRAAENGPGVYWGPLHAGGHKTGRFVLIDSSHANPWLYMSIHDADASGTATCQVLLANNKVVTAGTFWLDRGYGSWGVRLPAGSKVKAMWVMTDSGTLVGSARIET